MEKNKRMGPVRSFWCWGPLFVVVRPYFLWCRPSFSLLIFRVAPSASLPLVFL